MSKKGGRGDVALDEIVFAPNRRCTPVAELDGINHYCDFEIDTCGYINDNTATEKWNRYSPGSALIQLNAPLVDNTYQTKLGNYMQYRVTEKRAENYCVKIYN